MDATSTRFQDTGIGLRVALQNHPSAMGFRMLVREVMEKELAAGYVVEWKWRDVLPWFILLVGAVAKLHATRMSRCTSVHCCVHQPGCLCLRGRSSRQRSMGCQCHRWCQALASFCSQRVCSCCLMSVRGPIRVRWHDASGWNISCICLECSRLEPSVAGRVHGVFWQFAPLHVGARVARAWRPRVCVPVGGRFLWRWSIACSGDRPARLLCCTL